MSNELLNIQDLIELIKVSLEKDKRVKVCVKYQADKALQIQLTGGEIYNLGIAKINKSSYSTKKIVP